MEKLVKLKFFFLIIKEYLIKKKINFKYQNKKNNKNLNLLFWNDTIDRIEFLIKVFNFKSLFILKPINQTMLVSDKFVNFQYIYKKNFLKLDLKFIKKLILRFKLFFIFNDKIYKEIEFKFYLINKFYDSIKERPKRNSLTIYEFGGGLGFQAIVNNYILKPKKIIIYDLDLISKIQKKIFKIFDIDNIFHSKSIKIYKNKKKLFFSSWGFSEISNENKINFEKQIISSKYVCIYFQNEFIHKKEVVNNLLYFSNLKKKLIGFEVKIGKEKSIRSNNHYYFFAKNNSNS